MGESCADFRNELYEAKRIARLESLHELQTELRRSALEMDALKAEVELLRSRKGEPDLRSSEQVDTPDDTGAPAAAAAPSAAAESMIMQELIAERARGSALEATLARCRERLHAAESAQSEAKAESAAAIGRVELLNAQLIEREAALAAAQEVRILDWHATCHTCHAHYMHMPCICHAHEHGARSCTCIPWPCAISCTQLAAYLGNDTPHPYPCACIPQWNPLTYDRGCNPDACPACRIRIRLLHTGACGTRATADSVRGERRSACWGLHERGCSEPLDVD